MRRPDQDRYNDFTTALTRIDAALVAFCRDYGFSMEENANRVPSRILRRGVEPQQVIDIYLEGEWRDMPLESPRFYAFVAGCYSKDVAEPCKLWHMKEDLLRGATLESLDLGLPALLDRSLSLFAEWSTGIVRRRGVEVPNFREIYRERFSS